MSDKISMEDLIRKEDGREPGTGENWHLDWDEDDRPQAAKDMLAELEKEEITDIGDYMEFLTIKNKMGEFGFVIDDSIFAALDELHDKYCE